MERLLLNAHVECPGARGGLLAKVAVELVVEQMLEEASGAVDQDGVVGSLTEHAVWGAADQNAGSPVVQLKGLGGQVVLAVAEHHLGGSDDCGGVGDNLRRGKGQALEGGRAAYPNLPLVRVVQAAEPVEVVAAAAGVAE